MDNLAAMEKFFNPPWYSGLLDAAIYAIPLIILFIVVMNMLNDSKNDK
jgi:hypothetical protein